VTNRALLLTLIALIGSAGAAQAQGAPPPQQPAQIGNPACLRLEAQLAAIDRTAVDPNQATQQRRSDDAIAKQQSDLDRLVAQARRLSCDAGLFSIFTGQNPQCGPLNNQIAQARSNLDRLINEQQRAISGGAADRDNQRSAVLNALAQNNCGPQYRSAARGGGILDSLFGNNNSVGDGGATPWAGSGDTYKTICVRSCDGYYFPISFAATAAKFHDDEQVCQRACPAAEANLYTFRNPGEDVTRAVSLNGRPYTELPNAFKYRTEMSNACSCRKPGQSWADALGSGKDDALEQGDIVVTPERAKAMSLPQQQRGAARKPNAGTPAAAPAPAQQQTEPPATAESGEKKPIRTVGPRFLTNQ
jgi:hypothetical protein